MKYTIGDYDYYSTKSEAAKTVKSRFDVIAHEGGLGWYIYDKIEYDANWGRKMFGSIFPKKLKNGKPIR